MLLDIKATSSFSKNQGPKYLAVSGECGVSGGGSSFLDEEGGHTVPELWVLSPASH